MSAAQPQAPANSAAPACGRMLLRMLRLAQWPKNGLLFAGYIFAGRLRSEAGLVAADLLTVSLACIAFCLLSSACYIMNDLHDLEPDRAHPEKALRPLASGQVTAAAARGLMLVLLFASSALAVVVTGRAQSPWFAGSALAYLTSTMSYSRWLKHFVIIDVMALALGFVIRVVAGCVAIDVSISSWLLLCTFNLALFMALCKRRHELVAFGAGSSSVRRVLDEYSPDLLNLLIGLAASASYLSYCLYVLQAPHRDFMGGESPWLLVTVLPVFSGLGRYLHLVYRRERGGKPEDLLRDAVIAGSVIAWCALVITLSRLGA